MDDAATKLAGDGRRRAGGGCRTFYGLGQPRLALTPAAEAPPATATPATPAPSPAVSLLPGEGRPDATELFTMTLPAGWGYTLQAWRGEQPTVAEALAPLGDGLARRRGLCG